jgi:hypothetical protein
MLAEPSGPSRKEDWMTYSFRLQRPDGSPADPPTYRSTVLRWRQGETIPLGPDRTLRVLGVRDDDADQPPALVVEEVSDRARAPLPDPSSGPRRPLLQDFALAAARHGSPSVEHLIRHDQQQH